MDGPALGGLSPAGFHLTLGNAEDRSDAGDIHGIEGRAVQHTQNRGRQVGQGPAQRRVQGREADRGAQMVRQFHRAGAGLTDDGARAGIPIDPVDRVPIERLAEHA